MYGINIDKTYGIIFNTICGADREHMNLSKEEFKQLYTNKCICLPQNTNDIHYNCMYERVAILPTGDVCICEKMTNLVLGNIHKESLKQIQEGRTMKQYVSSCKLEMKECIACEEVEYCIRCNGLSYISTGNIHGCCKEIKNAAKLIKYCSNIAN